MKMFIMFYPHREGKRFFLMGARLLDMLVAEVFM